MPHVGMPLQKRGVGRPGGVRVCVPPELLIAESLAMPTRTTGRDQRQDSTGHVALGDVSGILLRDTPEYPPWMPEVSLSCP